MNTIEDISQILIKMNNNHPKLEDFFEYLVNESNSQNKFTFTKFKKGLDEKYPNLTMNEKIKLLKTINIENDISINLIGIFTHWERVLSYIIPSVSLSFFKISYIFEKILKKTVKEFVLSEGISQIDSFDINMFYNIMKNSLKLNETNIKIIFKSLDINKTGKVSIDHFIYVISTYSQEYKKNYSKINKIQKEYDLEELRMSCLILNSILFQNSVKYIFENTINKDFTSDIYEIINILDKINVNNDSNKSILKELTLQKSNITSILNFLKQSDGFIYKKDFYRIILYNERKNIYYNAKELIEYQLKRKDEKFKIDKEELNEILNTEGNIIYSKSYFYNFFLQSKVKVLKYSKFNLNEKETYWIEKLKNFLMKDNISIESLFLIAREDNSTVDNSLLYINLDILKKKLKIVISSSEISANDINNIIQVLDINKNRKISKDDFFELLNYENNLNENKDKKEIEIINTNKSFPIRGNKEVIEKISQDMKKKEEIKKVNFDKTNKPKYIQNNNNKLISNELDLSIPSRTNENNSQLLIKDNFHEKIIKDMISQLDVFEKGEWSLIEIFEEIKFNNRDFISVCEFYQNSLLPTYYPAIDKSFLFDFIKEIDINKIGLINIKDIIKFLLDNFHHKSTKLSLKYICYLIEVKLNSSIDIYFNKIFENKDSSISFIEFIKVLTKNFDLPVQIFKKLYYEISELINRPISIGDIIDIVKEYSIRQYNDNENYSNLNILDKKYFQIEISKISSFIFSIFPIDSNQRLVTKALDYYLRLEGIVEIDLNLFRERFVKGFNLEYSTGISIFQLLKTLSLSSNKGKVLKNDLYEILNSYYHIDNSISKENIFNLNNSILLMESSGPELKTCFESIIITMKDYYIAIHEIIKYLYKFYPFFPKESIVKSMKSLDKNSKGYITSYNMIIFLYENSSKSKFSEILILKYFALLCDFYNEDIHFNKFHIKEEDVKNYGIVCILNKHLTSNSHVSIQEHLNFFSDLIGLPVSLSEELFIYLIKHSQVIKEEDYYDKNSLINMMNHYRLTKTKENVFDNSKKIEIIMKKKEILKENIKKYLLLYKDFNHVLNKIRLCLIDCNKKNNKQYFRIDEMIFVNIIDLNRCIIFEYKDFHLSSSKDFYIKIKEVLLYLDKNKKGYITYVYMIKVLSELIDDFEISPSLHLQYLSLYKQKEFTNPNEYLLYKNINLNTYMNYNEFTQSFQDEFFNNQSLLMEVYNKLKEYKGKNQNKVSIDLFIELIFSNYKIEALNDDEKGELKTSQEEKIIQILVENYNLIDFLINNIITKSINSNGKINYNQFYNLISITNNSNNNIKHMNNYENLDEDCSKEVKLISEFKFLQINSFLSYFSFFNGILFDLFKFLEFLYLELILPNKINSDYKHNFNINQIKEKSKSSFLIKFGIDNKLKFTLSDFEKKYNLNIFSSLSIGDFLNISSSLFIDLSLFERLFLFYYSFSYSCFKENSNMICSFKINLYTIFEFIILIPLFEKNQILEEKKKKLSGNILRYLTILSTRLINEKRKKHLFDKFDSNGNGILSREEFFSFLKEYLFNELNDSQLLEIVNFADMNKDDCIDYKEFIEFLIGITEKEEKNGHSKMKSDLKIISNMNLLLMFKEEGIFKSNYNYSFQRLKSIYDKNKESLMSKNILYEIYILIQNMLILEFESWDNIEFSFLKTKKVFIDDYSPDYFIENSIYSKGFINIVSKQVDGKNVDKTNFSEEFINIYNSSKSRVISHNLFIDIILSILDVSQIINSNSITNVELSYLIINDLIEYSSKDFDKKIKNKFLLDKLIDYDFLFRRILNFELKQKEKESEVLNNLSLQSDKIRVKEVVENVNEKNQLKQVKELDKPQILNNLHINNDIDKNIMKDYSYSNDDFFIREIISKKVNIKYETILLSEEAALKKCEEIFNSLGENEKFNDKEFGDSSTNKELNKISIYSYDNISYGSIPPSNIEWKRIDNFSDNPIFIDSNIDSSNMNKIIKGSLGNSWFISSLSLLKTNRSLINGNKNDFSFGIFPIFFHKFALKRIYCFKFFKDNKWIWVIIDDKLPSLKNQNRIIFGRSSNHNEFYISLIEKAYAKLHGSYISLTSGHIEDGLSDLTGLLFERLIIDNQTLDFKKDLWNKIINIINNKSNFIIGCSAEGDKNRELEIVYKGHKCGIIANYSYSIIEAYEKKDKNVKIRYLKLVNTWSNKQYDNFSIKQKKDEGFFIIDFNDFLNIFNKVFICKDIYKNYPGFTVIDKVNQESIGGIPIKNNKEENMNLTNNPQYYLKINNKTCLYIVLNQKDPRLDSEKFPFLNKIAKSCLIINKITDIIKVNQFNKESLIQTPIIKQSKSIITHLELDSGEYLVTPCFDMENINDKILYFSLKFYFENGIILENKEKSQTEIRLIYNIILNKLNGSFISSYITNEKNSSFQTQNSLNSDLKEKINKAKLSFI